MIDQKITGINYFSHVKPNAEGKYRMVLGNFDTSRIGAVQCIGFGVSMDVLNEFKANTTELYGQHGQRSLHTRVQPDAPFETQWAEYSEVREADRIIRITNIDFVRNDPGNCYSMVGDVEFLPGEGQRLLEFYKSVGMVAFRLRCITGRVFNELKLVRLATVDVVPTDEWNLYAPQPAEAAEDAFEHWSVEAQKRAALAAEQERAEAARLAEPNAVAEENAEATGDLEEPVADTEAKAE